MLERLSAPKKNERPQLKACRRKPKGIRTEEHHETQVVFHAYRARNRGTARKPLLPVPQNSEASRNQKLGKSNPNTLPIEKIQRITRFVNLAFGAAGEIEIHRRKTTHSSE